MCIIGLKILIIQYVIKSIQGITISNVKRRIYRHIKEEGSLRVKLVTVILNVPAAKKRNISFVSSNGQPPYKYHFFRIGSIKLLSRIDTRETKIYVFIDISRMWDLIVYFNHNMLNKCYFDQFCSYSVYDLKFFISLEALQYRLLYTPTLL